MVRYSVTTELWKEEGEEPVVCYGIVGQCTDGGETAAVSAISTDRAFVCRLCELLGAGGVSLVHMRDVIEDALWEREDVPFPNIGELPF